MPILFLLFTVIPLVELWLLFEIGGAIGALQTVGIVVLTGIVGAALARWQGFQALQRVQNDMQQGVLPTKALGDGVLILMAGVLLITPGVLTDLVGLSLLIPPLRALVRKGLGLWLSRNVQVQTNVSWQGESGFRTQDENVVEAKVIDAHVVDED